MEGEREEVGKRLNPLTGVCLVVAGDIDLVN